MQTTWDYGTTIPRFPFTSHLVTLMTSLKWWHHKKSLMMHCWLHNPHLKVWCHLFRMWRHIWMVTHMTMMMKKTRWKSKRNLLQMSEWFSTGSIIHVRLKALFWANFLPPLHGIRRIPPIRFAHLEKLLHFVSLLTRSGKYLPLRKIN